MKPLASTNHCKNKGAVAWLVPLGFLVLLCVPHCAQSLPGRVVVRSDEIRWGQYKNINGVKAVEFPRGEDLELEEWLKKFPVSGASAVLLRVQRPGHPFFTSDGRVLDKEDFERLRNQIHQICEFDMLPIVRVFDSDPACRLQSVEAYADAATGLVSELGDDIWFLLCLNERLNDPDWDRGAPGADHIGNALEIARAVKEEHSRQIVAAGSSNMQDNSRLVAEGSPIQAVMRVSDSLLSHTEEMEELGVPLIETVGAKSIDRATLAKAVRRSGLPRVDEDYQYGFALTLPSEAIEGTLETLEQTTDEVQKKALVAPPPSRDMNRTLSEEEQEKGFTSLFNGRDLSGWVQICKENNFVVEDGYIRTNRFKGGWLRSWEKYDDFVLRAEYWIEEGGNSGLFIRAPLHGRASRIGFEFQILGQSPETEPSKNSTGSLYDVRAPRSIELKPEDWNKVEIRCEGTHVRIEWNGETIHDFHYKDEPFMRGRATSGYIGLQDHYDRVKFRNLRIKRLN